jgi:exopolysaccharide biosynthesis protein
MKRILTLIILAGIIAAKGAAEVIIAGTAPPEKLAFRLRGESLSDLKVAVNGTFFSIRHKTLANWVVRDGKVLYPFPWWDSLERGCLVIFQDNTVYMGLVRSNGEKVFIGKKEIKTNEVRLAIGGGSYFLRRGTLATYQQLRKEGISPYIIEHRHFSFIAWNEKKNLIAIGISRGSSLWEIGKQLLRLGYTDAIRLDGGSSTGIWKPGRKFPNTTNIVGIKS